MNQIGRNIPRWLLAFIGSLLLFATCALVCIRMTLFNQKFMIQQIHQAGYIETIRNYVTESIQDLGRGSNIPPKVLADVVSEKMVATNVENYVRGIYQEVPLSRRARIRLKRIF